MSHLNQEIGGNFHILSLCGLRDGGGCVGVGVGLGKSNLIKEVAQSQYIILRLDLLERPLHNYLTSPIKRCPFLALNNFYTSTLNITADVKDEKQQQKTPKGPQNN